MDILDPIKDAIDKLTGEQARKAYEEEEKRKAQERERLQAEADRQLLWQLDEPERLSAAERALAKKRQISPGPAERLYHDEDDRQRIREAAALNGKGKAPDPKPELKLRTETGGTKKAGELDNVMEPFIQRPSVGHGFNPSTAPAPRPPAKRRSLAAEAEEKLAARTPEQVKAQTENEQRILQAEREQDEPQHSMEFTFSANPDHRRRH